MRQIYGLGEIYHNVCSLIYTKMFWKGARLIRRPFWCRGKKYFQYGRGFTTGYNCRIEAFQINDEKENKKIIIGNNCKMGDRVHISSCESVKIGENCLLASNIYISDNQHGIYKGANQSQPYEMPDSRKLEIKKVEIGDNVWIGENVVILPGARLGNGCIVGANSVVKAQFGDNEMIAGCPASIIKRYNDLADEWK